jgi:hypothetical protein
VNKIFSFAAALENEGVLGIAQATVAQTSHFAVSIASAATSTTFNVISEASTNAGQLLMGNFTNDDDVKHAVGSECDEHNHNHGKCDEETTPFILKIALDITDIMLGAISPMLVKYKNYKRENAQRYSSMEHKLIEANDDDTRTLSKFYDACDESEYFDANSSTDTISTDSVSGSSPLEESHCKFLAQAVPENIILQRSLTYYLDISDLMMEVDDSLTPLLLDGKFFAINDGDERVLQHVLDTMTDKSLRIANDSKHLRWRPDNSTKEILQRCSHNHTEERNETLEGNVLKWTSGNMLKTLGIVDIPPLDLMDLLLDCDRVNLFNKYSVGKEDVCTFAGVQTGEAKIVKNDMKIPVVGGTLQTLCITHSRLIENDNCGDSYIIVTQSVKNELKDALPNPLYSISVLRPVLNSDKTELTNISQIASMNIPKFLKHKVAFMGATDFFNNLRSLRI